LSSNAYRVEITRGDTYGPLEIRYEDSDGQPIDMTGYTVTWVLTLGSNEVPGTVDLDEEQGRMTLTVPHEVTAAIPQSVGSHRLRITAPIVKTLLKGRVTVDD